MKADTHEISTLIDKNSQSILKESKPQIMNKCIRNHKAIFLCTNDQCQSKNRFTCRVSEC